MKRFLCFFIVLLLFLFVSCVSSDSPSSTTSPSDAVDLGLSVKWAKCNLGSRTEDGYGDYFSWGETSTKLDYSGSTYKWNGWGDPSASEGGYTKYKSIDSYLLYLELSGKKEEDVPWVTVSDPDKQEIYTDYIDDPLYFRLEAGYHLDPADDAATVKLGSKWRLPTRDEWIELRTKCAWAWVNMNGVTGYRITGPSGNSIFLPASGIKYDTTIQLAGNKCGPWAYYWSATLENHSDVSCEWFYSTYVSESYWPKDGGVTIRPVFGDYPLAPKPEGTPVLFP